MKFGLGRPSPALVVAVLALIVALGGTGYAAVTLPAHSVGNKQLKRRAVTTSKIHHNAVTGSKVENNTLKGRDIDESRLAQVPDAHHADVAGTATSAGAANSAANAANAANADKLDGKDSSSFISTDTMHSFFHKLSAGQKVTLLQHGTITIEAECLDNQTVQTQANRDAVRMLVSTSQDGAIVIADYGDYHDGGSGGFLNTNTPVDDRELYVWQQPNGTARASFNIDSLSVVDPNGKVITSFGGEGFVAGVNLLGSACYIGGTFVIIA